MDKRFEKVLGILMIMALMGLIVFNIWEGNLYGLFDSGKGVNNETTKTTTAVSENNYVNSSGNYISSSGLINEYPGILRFHVVANSDSKEDQELKLKVRDYVLERVQGALANEIAMSTDYGDVENSSSADANIADNIGDSDNACNSDNACDDLELALSQNKLIREYVNCQLPLIEKWADEAVKLYGYQYDTTASIGIRHIPAKYYEELFFPEGNYEALTISIGEGEGQNWWCVVFPPLCLIESAANETTSENSSDKAYDNLKSNELSDNELSDTQRLILKSKTIELLEKHDSLNDNYDFLNDNPEFSVSRSCSNSISKSFVCLFE